MIIYVLIASDNSISGVYSSKSKLIADVANMFVTPEVSRIETWEVDKGFLKNLMVNKQVTLTIED